MSEYFNFLPTAYYVIVKSPGLYKFVLLLTFISSVVLVVYGHKMYKESQKYHDFFVPSIRIFVEPDFGERVLSFSLESLNDSPVYLSQVQVAIYDNQNNTESLYSATQTGRVNPLKRGDSIPFTYTLDNPPSMGFNFTNSIKQHEYVMQAYKVIVVLHYSYNSLSSIKSQRFEYLYNVSHDNGTINGLIREFPNQMNDSKLIFKNVPYEANGNKQ